MTCQTGTVALTEMGVNYLLQKITDTVGTTFLLRNIILLTINIVLSAKSVEMSCKSPFKVHSFTDLFILFNPGISAQFQIKIRLHILLVHMIVLCDPNILLKN